MKKLFPTFRKKTRDPETLSLTALILLGFSVLSLIIVIVARHNASFADFFNSRIGSVVRWILAKLTAPFPFSFAEFALLLLPVSLFLILRHAAKRGLKTTRSVIVYTVSLLSAVSMIFSLFVWSFGTGYYVPTLDKKLELKKENVSAIQLKDTAAWLSDELSSITESVIFGADGASVMPYSLSEMNDKLIQSYRKLGEKYPFIQQFNSRVKPVMGSKLMSYAHLTGVYTFFTGEANLNVDFPDYTLPYTAAHELAHQRGVARENEANFLAFLVCIESDDPYLRYSGYMNLYEYVMNALYAADAEMYQQIRSIRCPAVSGEMKAYAIFYETYRDSTAGKINNTVNNAFLQANGESEGTRSYGLVVDLAVAYFEAKK